MNKKEVYDSRMKLFSDVVNHKIPERVPLCPFVETWVFHYANTSIKKAFMEDNNLLFEAIKKYTEDVPIDAIASISNTVPFKMGMNFGEGIYNVSNEGVQIKGSHGKTMEGEELVELAKGAKEFFANILAPRKFPVLNQSLEKNIDLLKKSIDDLNAFNAYNGQVIGRIENELGVPVIIKGTNYMPMDVVLDYLRDFVGISSDIRKRPNELYAACEELYDYVMEMFLDTAAPADNKWLFTPLHIPTYMRPKDFEKLYFPFMKKYIEEFGVKRGYTLHFFMENDWTPYLDILQDLPIGAKVVGLFELGDLKFIKEKLKDRMVFHGGLPVNILRYGTKEEVRDHVKKTFDELAPGGGFIYGTDYSVMNLNDAKPENLIEAMTFAKEYGRY